MLGHRLGRRFIPPLAAALVLMAVVPASAYIFEFKPLSDKVLNRLPRPAREAYLRGTDHLDHIRRPAALKAFEEAIEAAPNVPQLRFVAMQLARHLGDVDLDMRNQDAAYLALIKHAKAVMEMKNLNPRLHDLAERELARAERIHGSLQQRDEARRAFGRQIVNQYAKEIYTEENESAETKKFQKALDQLIAGGKASDLSPASDTAKELAKKATAESATAPSSNEINAGKVVELVVTKQFELAKPLFTEELRSQLEQAGTEALGGRVDAIVQSIGFGKFKSIEKTEIVTGGDSPIVRVTVAGETGRFYADVEFDKDGLVAIIPFPKMIEETPEADSSQ